MGWAGGGLSPRYWEFYHSDNAHKPQTNNVTNTDNKALDTKIMAYRTATEKVMRVKLAHELEQMIHDQGSFIPTFKVPYTREAFWRWIKLPPSHGTRTSETLFDPLGSSGGLFWIDADEQQTILDAKAKSQALPQIIIIDKTWAVKP